MMSGKTFDYIIVDELYDMEHKKLNVRFEPRSVEKIQDAKLKISRIVHGALSDPLLPDDLVKLIIENGVVSGGISASVFHNEHPNDYDIYFKDMESVRQFAKIMTRHNLVKNIVKDVNPRYHVVTHVNGKLVTSRATTLFNNLQIITMGTYEMIKDFDFIHCKPFLDLKENRYFISPKEYKSIEHKVLIKNKTAAKIDKKRIEKFKDRGWKDSSI